VRASIIVLLITLALGLLCAPLAADAPPPKHVPRIGLLITNSRAAEATNLEAFRRGLHVLGYVEGQNILLESRFADGNVEHLPPFAAELVRLNVAVIVTTGTPPTRAAQHATQTAVSANLLCGFERFILQNVGIQTFGQLSSCEGDLRARRSLLWWIA
jgi:putative ABC transport system substrate-binding protein